MSPAAVEAIAKEAGLVIAPSCPVFLSFLAARLVTVGIGIEEGLPLMPAALLRLAATFSMTRNRYYREESTGRPVLLTGHYSQSVLLFHALAREANATGLQDLANRIYFLNTAQSSCDIHFEIDLPIKTHCDHPLGSVIGRATFGAEAGLVFADGCGIGNNWGRYPHIEGMLVMTSRSAVIGKTEIHGTVVLGRGATLIDAGRVENCLVVGEGRNVEFRPLDPAKVAALVPFSVRAATNAVG